MCNLSWNVLHTLSNQSDDNVLWIASVSGRVQEGGHVAGGKGGREGGRPCR